MLRDASRFVTLAVMGLVVVGCAAQRSSGWLPREAEPPQPGGVAPSFALASDAGDTISLTDFKGRSPVLLYFSMGPG